MNKEQREICIQIREQTSEEAATWIVNLFQQMKASNKWVISPAEALTARSWLVGDQLRLAHYFLQSVPHATGRVYGALLSVMSVNNFLKVMREYLPKDKSRLELLFYYLETELRKSAKNQKDESVIKAFLTEFEEFRCKD